MTRSTNAAVNIESINTRFHWSNSKWEVLIILFCSYQSEINGGDGIVWARYLHMNHFAVELVFPFGLPRSRTSMEQFQYYRSLRFPYCQEVDCSREFT